MNAHGATHTIKDAPAWLVDTSSWPTVDVSLLSPVEQVRFSALHEVMAAYIRREPVRELLKTLGLSHTQILRTFRKCISQAPGGRLQGWRGLLWGIGRKPYVRTAAVLDGRSATGALQQMFDRIDGLKDRLVNLVLRRDKPGDVHEARIPNNKVHVAFINECRQAGVAVTEWPFISRFKGARSIDSFVKNVLAANVSKGVDARHGAVAASHLGVGTGHQRLRLAQAPFDLAEMDSHRLDLIGTVGIPTPMGVVYVAIERLQLLLIADVLSSNILSFYVIIRRECQSADILKAARYLELPWAPRALVVAGMTYRDGVGVPHGTVEGLGPFGIGALLVDCALINKSWAVVHRLVDRLGCAVNWGPVRKWMRRPLVERIFRSLEQAGFQRAVSTVGSHPKDPRKRDPVGAAVKHRIDVETILDLVDVEVSAFNGQTNEGRYGLKPHEVIQQAVAGVGPPTLVPVLPPTGPLNPGLTVLFVTAHIRGNMQSGHRPSIKYARARYTNPVISDSPALIGREVVLHVNPDDITVLQVFLKTTGESLGAVVVLGHWRARPHTLEMRLQINRAIDEGRLDVPAGMDPITAFHEYLAKRALKRGTNRRPRVSKDATTLAREANLTQQPLRERQPRRIASSPCVIARDVPQFRHDVGSKRT